MGLVRIDKKSVIEYNMRQYCSAAHFTRLGLLIRSLKHKSNKHLNICIY